MGYITKTIWEDTCVKFSQEFSHTKPLQIQIVNVEGLYGGGIRREFFGCAIESAGELLEGFSDDNKSVLAKSVYIIIILNSP